VIGRPVNKVLVERFSASFHNALRIKPAERDTTMSRIAKEPVVLPKGVEFSRAESSGGGTTVTFKGGKGSLSMELNSEVELATDGNTLTVKARSGSRFAIAVSGTTRALLANMAHGVSEGFEKKLQLIRWSMKFRREFRWRPRARRKSWSGEPTSRKSARLLRRYAISGHRSPIKAKVFDMSMNMSS